MLNEEIAEGIIHRTAKAGKCSTLLLVASRDSGHSIQKLIEKQKSNISVISCQGNNQTNNDIQRIQSGVDVVIATVIRIADLVSKKIIKLSNVKTLLVDNASEIISRGCRDQLVEIIRSLPDDVHINIWTDNLTEEVRDLKKGLKDPVIISRTTSSDAEELLSLHEVSQFFVNYRQNEWKAKKLMELFHTFREQAVIFCNSRFKVDELAKELMQVGLTVSTLHGDLSQSDRETVVELFLNGATNYLICTDLLAKSVKLPQITLVINYDLPTNKRNYMHRLKLELMNYSL